MISCDIADNSYTGTLPDLTTFLLALSPPTTRTRNGRTHASIYILSRPGVSCYHLFLLISLDCISAGASGRTARVGVHAAGRCGLSWMHLFPYSRELFGCLRAWGCPDCFLMYVERVCVSTVALMGVVGQPVLEFTLQDHATSVGCTSFRTAGSFLDASGPGGVQIAF